MRLPRQEDKSVLPFLLQEIFPTQELNSCLLFPVLAEGFFTTVPPQKTWSCIRTFSTVKQSILCKILANLEFLIFSTENVNSIELPRWFDGLKKKKIHLQWNRSRLNFWAGQIPWRRKWQPTLVFLPGKSRGQRILASYSSWSCQESDFP